MKCMEWLEVYDVGVEEINKQHRGLVRVTNKLFHAIMEDRGEELLYDILKELEEYAAFHFDYEERLLREHEYPKELLERHIREHDKLKADVADYIQRLEGREVAMDLDLFAFLRDWTENHMRNTDMLYRDFFNARGVY
ncbi:bacteriohemerythrin [Pseudodesulfovibrio cashew]|uniref:Bacteriohemerythrin n=1 Tax=Pseudodesulfovibrio cashew TaxID=2678688 RepID=A0A6I6JLG4_9BACT|nr:bacteriohemerythrin [Pseudodesulfovibrio cashew]QGY41093.1 bacteriohemerythrin [Pseudodesulfovibrio cashew]